MDGVIDEVWIVFDPKGSLAETHHTQGSDMGLFGGLLGWEADDERLIDSATAIHEAGIKVHIEIRDYGAVHPNTYRLKLKNSVETRCMTAVSKGGGTIEIVEIDGVPLSIAGDCFETLVYISDSADGVFSFVSESVQAEEIRLCTGNETRIIEIKTNELLDDGIRTRLESEKPVFRIKRIAPVLSVLTRKETAVPFLDCDGLTAYNGGKNLELWELALHYEAARGNISQETVFETMRHIVSQMRDSISQGLKGTEFPDRILGWQSGNFKAQMDRNSLLEGGILNQIILYVTATMETKSAMGIIVAAPTAGSCGTLPGVCFGTADAMGLSEDDIVKALLAAGMIGIFISARSTFAAEVCGCQAECGAASGMAAAALVSLANGTTRQAVNAASMALQNIFGMVCDPVAKRVEVPCLGKNVLAASNAVASANMALADFDPVIPLDEVIEAMDRVGRSIPSGLRCTGRGGLSGTKAAKAIEEKLNEG